ncbi:hypothetical protein LPO01_18620 [Ligilactobacillus pobuzihii]|nr:hypothetical protein LPO01_18620 [Ligilactobacillus pobuzihii]
MFVPILVIRNNFSKEIIEQKGKLLVIKDITSSDFDLASGQNVKRCLVLSELGYRRIIVFIYDFKIIHTDFFYFLYQYFTG